MKYSVIIPVYNAAGTIGRCLDSLLDQAHGDAEILLINDGSTDESGRICRTYAQTHPCVRCYEKENGGVSSARNLGLEKAAGEYILFVDSDDYVAADYFAVIGRAVERWDPDMLMFGLKCFGGRESIWKTENFFSEDPLEIGKMARKMSYAYLYSNLMTRVFRRTVIREQALRFDESIWVGEDQAFIFAYTMHVKKMVSLDHVLYHYATDNQDSLSKKPRPYLSDHMLKVGRLMQESLDRTQHPEPVRRIYQEAVSWSHYRGTYSACKELYKFDLPATERRNRIREVCAGYRTADIAPAGLHTWLIALPVLWNMAWLMDLMAGCRVAYRKRTQR